MMNRLRVLLIALSAAAAALPAAVRAEQSGDWTYTLKPKGESSAAVSNTVDGATIRFECDGDWVRPTFHVETGQYAPELIITDPTFLHVDNGRKAARYESIALSRGYHEAGEWTVFPPHELDLVRRWAAAPSAIVVALTAGKGQAAARQPAVLSERVEEGARGADPPLRTALTTRRGGTQQGQNPQPAADDAVRRMPSRAG